MLPLAQHLDPGSALAEGAFMGKALLWPWWQVLSSWCGDKAVSWRVTASPGYPWGQKHHPDGTESVVLSMLPGLDGHGDGMPQLCQSLGKPRCDAGCHPGE